MPAMTTLFPLTKGSATLSKVIERAAECYPDREALVVREQRLDFRTLHGRVEDFAKGLLELGLRPGDHIVLWMPNGIEWNIALFAVARIGAVAVTCNTRYKSLELGYLLQNSNARAIIMPARFAAADIDFFALLREAGTAGLEHIILVGDDQPGEFGVPVTPFGEVEANGARTSMVELDAIVVQPEDIALMIYTSGTTGAPKGCMLSHRSLLIRAVQRTRMFPWQIGERLLVSMPYFHIAGILGPIIGSALQGSAQVIMDKFDAREAVDLIEREKITFMSGVPTMFIGMLSLPDFTERDISSLRTITLGSADIPPSLMRQLADPREGMGLRALIMYGQTEAGGATHCSRADDPIELLTDTVGLPVEGVEDRIVDPDTGEDRPLGVPGEIWVRGEGMMSGFYKMPEATTDRFAGEWLRTGDVGYKDETGHLRITGRLSDVILAGGFNVYPVEIENLLMQHPAIDSVAVIGVPDPIMGQSVMACVVPKAGSTIQPAEVRAAVNGRIANFKVPRYVRFFDELPMNASGKVQKFRLREAVESENLEDHRVS